MILNSEQNQYLTKLRDALLPKLMNGEIDLDSSIETYSEAMKLAKICGDKLTKATESVNKILMDNGEEKDFKVEE